MGPRRVAAELRSERWGRLVISHNGVYRALRRHGIGTRRRRLALIAGYQSPPEPERPAVPEELHLEAETPGALVQLDCFHVGRLQGTRGRVWQYAATVARDLHDAGWKTQAVSTDNGSEFRSGEFRSGAADARAEHRFIRAGRPQTNGRVERVRRAVLEERRRPTFARSLVPKYTALRRDLERYTAYFDFDRAHLGRHTQGRTPAEAVYGSRKMRPR